MLKLIGYLILSPLFLLGIALRLAFFLPFAALFLLPVVLMRPRLLLRAPRMFRYMLFAKRSGWAGCTEGRGFGGGRRQLVTVTEPVRL